MQEVRKVDLSDIEKTDISNAIDIAWSTVGTVTPAGQQKLLLNYALNFKEPKPSTMNAGDEGRGIGAGGGGRVSGPQRGGGGGGGGRREEGRGVGSGNMRYGEGGGGRITNYQSDVTSRGQYGGFAHQAQYPAPTRSSDGRAYVGKI